MTDLPIFFRRTTGGERAMPLAPVLNPFYNIDKICGECTLLEDHLKNPSEQCMDCINKHLKKMEALFEEAVGLDSDNELPDEVKGYPQTLFKIRYAANTGAPLAKLAPQVRKIRKAMTPVVVSAMKTGKLTPTHHVAASAATAAANGTRVFPDPHSWRDKDDLDLDLPDADFGIGGGVWIDDDLDLDI